MPAVIAALKELLGKAQESAQSWNNSQASKQLTTRQKDFGSKVQQSQIEQWAINKSIHYNEWAQLQKEDFAPVVGAFKNLLACFRCKTCEAFIYVSPTKGQKESIRCDCGDVNFNLKKRTDE